MPPPPLPPSCIAQLVPIVNKLQDVLSVVAHEPLDLPQIVVVGAQSAGKSSVLESIVQRDFLPRGTDIVTRRPLVLQLIQTRTANSDASIDTHPQSNASSAAKKEIRSLAKTPPDEWGEFLHRPGERFFDFTEIRDEIAADTARLAGTNKGIAREPIFLKIYSPRLPTLTLVDLPGLTKIPVGDQPPDIEARIRQLVWEHIASPNAIILAVTPANADLATSDALKLSREADPEGRRTLGVLTKVDLMDAGTHAADILSNRASYRMRLGFVGVVNRSQQDVARGKPIADALRHEADFFRTHPAYRSFADRCGSLHLASTLSSLLMAHIREQLPALRMRLNHVIAQKQSAVAAYGDLQLGAGRGDRGIALLHFLTRYASAFCACIDGTAYISSPFIVSGEALGGARISFIFTDVFSQAVGGDFGSFGAADVKAAIRATCGTRPSLFVPEAAFELLVRRTIAKAEAPAARCVELVCDELLQIAGRCACPELRRFPSLLSRTQQVAAALVRERLQPTLRMVHDLVAIELAHTNTSHPDFLRADAAVSALGKIYERRRREGVRPPFASRTAADAAACTSPISPNADDAPSKKTDRPSPFAFGEGANILSYIFRSSAVGDSNAAPKASVADKQTPRLDAASAIRQMAPPKTDRFDDEGLLMAAAMSSHIDPLAAPATSLRSLPLHPQACANFVVEAETAPSFSHTGVEFSSEKEEMEVHLIYALVQSYGAVVRKNLQDSIPKAIMHFMVNNVKESLQNRLISSMYKEELFDELLQEDPKIVAERDTLRSSLEAFKQAASILNDIKEFCWNAADAVAVAAS